MTKEQAIQFANCLKNNYTIDFNDMADFCDMAIKALEKDISKTPKKCEVPRYGIGYEFYDYYCPTCSKFLAYECDTKRKYIHHCECGQRLDWGCDND